MTAIILHGICSEHEYFEMDFPSPSNAHWFPWLQQKFLRSGVLCQTLEMPAPYDPIYEDWKDIFEQINIDDLSIVVGHSAGCGFILKWLSENKEKTLDKLILVAPYQDPNKDQGNFLQCTFDPDLENRISEMQIFFSEDESNEGVVKTKDQILATYSKAQLHSFKDKGHFCFSNVGLEFPELWAACK